MAQWSSACEVAAHPSSFSKGMRKAQPCAAANPAIALWLQSTRPVGRVAELGSLSMSGERAWHVNGHVSFPGSPAELGKTLATAGLQIKPGRYAVRIADCSHFVFRCVDEPESGSIFEVDADADSEAEMIQAATLVSEALRASSIRYTFEVYSPSNEMVKNIKYNG